MHINLIEMQFWRYLAIFLLICAPLGIVLSLLLIFKPQSLERLNHMSNRWITSRHLSELLDRGISIEHWFYRHHKAFGAAVLLGSLYVFIYFGFLFDKAYALQNLNWKIPRRMIDALLDSLVLFSLTGAVVAFIVGLFLWLRPSLLRDIETDANKWVSSRQAIKIMDVPRDQVDRFVTHHARRFGWLLLVGSIYLFFITFRSLM